jgi:hypothetical protein
MVVRVVPCFLNKKYIMIKINGKSYQGNNVSIINNKVYIDGVLQNDSVDSNSKQIYITIEGNIEKLEVDNCDEIKVNGDVNVLDTKNGNVVCKNVHGDVTSKNGNIVCTQINGNVETKNGNVIRN